MKNINLKDIKEQIVINESRIRDLKQKKIFDDSNDNLIKDPIYDLYTSNGYVFLNLELPGVLDQKIEVKINEYDIWVSGEFPDLTDGKNVEYLQKKRASGLFKYHFIIPTNSKIDNQDWQLVHGILQIRLKLKKILKTKILKK